MLEIKIIKIAISRCVFQTQLVIFRRLNFDMRGTDLLQKSVFKVYYVTLNMHSSYIVKGDAQCENTLLLYIYIYIYIYIFVAQQPPC